MHRFSQTAAVMSLKGVIDDGTCYAAVRLRHHPHMRASLAFRRAGLNVQVRADIDLFVRSFGKAVIGTTV